MTTEAQALTIVRNKKRAAIFETLSRSRAPMSPAQIARRLGLPVNLVAYHMALLAKQGAVEMTGTRPRRGSTEHFYRPSVRINVRPTRAKPALVIKGGKNGSVFFATPAKVTVKAR